MISFGDGTARQPNNPQQNKQFQRLNKHTSMLRFIQFAQKRKNANAHLLFYGKTQIIRQKKIRHFGISNCLVEQAE
jgi:hypothetical protein